MGLYNVVAPCVVGKLHYARPTTQPIEVDDAEAGPLVEAGCLTPYLPGEVVHVFPSADGVYEVPGDTGTVLDGDINVAEPDETPAPRPRPRRRTED